MFLLMLIVPLGWNFKMECLSILIAKMGAIVWLITELLEAVIEIYTSYGFSNSFVWFFVFCYQNKSDDCFWKINLSFTSVYDNKMTSFVELLTIALLFCPLWLDKTINFCFPYICFYKFTHSVITVQKLFSKAHLLLGVLLWFSIHAIR